MNKKVYKIVLNKSVLYYIDGEFNEESKIKMQLIGENFENEVIKLLPEKGIVYIMFNDKDASLSLYADEGTCTVEEGYMNMNTGEYSGTYINSFGISSENNVLYVRKIGDDVECTYKREINSIQDTNKGFKTDNADEIENLQTNNEILLSIYADKKVVELYSRRFAVDSKSIYERLLQLEDMCKSGDDVYSKLQLVEYDMSELLIRKEAER